MPPSELLQTAMLAARKAGRELLAAWTGALEVVHQDEGDIKLEMDRRAEAVILDTIRERYPLHGVLSEECGEIAGEGVQWIVDPLDGTHNYFRRIPCWCVSVGAVIEGEPRLGVIYDPVRDQMLAGEKGGGVRLNGQAVRVSEARSLSGSIVTFGCYHSEGASVEAWLRRTGWITPRARSMRNLGAAALHCACVACGQAEAFVEYGVRLWDVAAGIALAIEAGGRVSQWPCANGGLDIVLAAPAVHDELLASGLWPFRKEAE